MEAKRRKKRNIPLRYWIATKANGFSGMKSKQSSLEAIMKAENEAKQAEEARKQERENVSLVRRANAIEKSKNNRGRGRRGSKKKKKCNRNEVVTISKANVNII